MSERKLIILGLVSIMLLGLAACGPSSKPDPTALPYTPMAWDQPTATAAVVPSGDAEAGAVVFEQYCQQCHSLEEDVNIAGPSLFDAGEILTMDYVQQSIIDPHAEIVFVENAQFTDAQMPTSFVEQLSEKQLDDVVAFVMSLTKDTSAHPGR